MQSIRYMMFRAASGQGPFYFVGTDIGKMRATAKCLDRTADDGEEINSERAFAAAETDQDRRSFGLGVRSAKSGTTDYYLFG